MSTTPPPPLNITENDHLPPISSPPRTAVRPYKRTGSTSTYGFQLNNNHNHNHYTKTPPTSERKSPRKSLVTAATTLKRPVNGGPVIVNGTPPSNTSRTLSSESNRKLRRFWWSPQRNQIEIRSERNHFKQVPSRIAPIFHSDYHPSGGQVSIRDEHVHWNVSSKVNSLSNRKWSPPPPNVTIRSDKLRWNVHSKIGSLINKNHRPGGGNVAIRDEKINFRHVTPRVDCGFIE